MHDSVHAPGVAPAWAAEPAPNVERVDGHAGPDFIPYVSLLLFLLAMYGVAPETVPATAVLRPALTLGLGALLFLLVERTVSGRAFRLAWPESYALLGFFCAAGLSTFAAIWPGLAVQKTVELAKLLVLYLLIVNVIRNRTRLRGLLWTLVVVGAMPAIGTIQNYLAGNVVDGRAAWIGKFANPNIIAFEMTILVPLAVALMVIARWRGRLLLAVLVLTYLVAIYFTFSRSGLIGLAVVVVLGTLRLRSNGLRLLVILAMVLALALALQFWARDSSFDELEGDQTFNQRLVSVQAGLAMFQANPLLGVGIGCAHLAWQDYTPDSYNAEGEWLMIHNTFVQALAETGIAGFSMLMLALVIPLFFMRSVARARRASDVEISAYASAIELSLVGLMISGLANGYMELAAPYLLIAIASSIKVVLESERLVEGI
jgi:O-antigen ligase